ncbi:MAG: translation initiation factor eIF-2B, partial [Candidatus Thorarchaeota archaeon]
DLLDLKQDSISGASELTEKALKIIENHLILIQNPNADITEDIYKLVGEIINTRPSMAPLINAMGFLIHDLTIITKKAIKKRLKESKIISSERKGALERNFHTFISSRKKDERNIMLISYSSTIIDFLLRNKDINFEIYILESRPLLEGRRTAKILSKYFKVNLIIDAAIGKFTSRIDFVLIGVDSVLRDGSIINKIGTYPLAVLAKSNKTDVFAICDSHKYNLRSHYGQEVIIEKKPSKEIYDEEGFNNLEIHNYYFDITPPDYITSIISDLGILSTQQFVEKVKENIPIEWFKYFLNNNC